MGLLDNALQAIKNQYQETKGNVGLLMSDPKQYMSGLNQDAAEYNRLSSLALQAERNAYRGMPVSQEQAAAKQYIDQQQQDMALGFTGNIKTVKPLGSIIDDATKSGLKLDVYEKNGVVNLSRIEVPKELRNSGIGSDVMNQIVNYADSTGNKVALTPSTDFGATSVSRLKDFYKKFGFVENKGKNKDFTTRETMYRNPKE
jgi:predicted GNAT family N-acyltransferase